MLKANGSKKQEGFPLQWLLNPLSGALTLFSFSWEEKETGQNWKFCTASQNLGFCKEPVLKRKRTAALKRKRTCKAVPKRKRQTLDHKKKNGPYKKEKNLESRAKKKTIN